MFSVLIVTWLFKIFNYLCQQHSVFTYFTGDLFEKKEDIEDSTLWRDIGGSLFPDKQEANRNKILRMADYIIPGHGPMFKVYSEMRNK